MSRYLWFLTLLCACNLSPEKENQLKFMILKNDHLEIQIDLPLENYNFTRFDWTGKITSVKFKGKPVSGVEIAGLTDGQKSGKGFYNEFGIDMAVGYQEISEGEWFHKIGVGLLKKEGKNYDFRVNYKVRPAEFTVKTDSGKVTMTCESKNVNGYSYVLTKEIRLLDDGFTIQYALFNSGEKNIQTNEYNHNFIGIDNELTGNDYVLKFPFQLNPELFGETVNPENKVEIGENEITFNATPNDQFFFSTLAGNEPVDAFWELRNTKNKIGISETGDFKTSKVNLWGWKHVISPELFFDVNVRAGETVKWSRTYRIFELE